MSRVSGPPRVLHLLAPAREGGLERVVTMMSAGQTSAGVHVAVVLAPREADNHPFTLRLEALGLPYTRIIVGGRSYLREYRALSALIDRLAPEVLHTHGYRADLIGGLITRSHRHRWVSTVHGFTGAGLRGRFYERLQRRLLRSADAVIAVSRPLVDRLTRAGIAPDKIHYVANGFSPMASRVGRPEARQELGIGAGGLIAAWVGRLSREKGPDVVLDALAQTPPSWQLAIIGDGPQREELQHRADRLGLSDRVHWLGSVPNAGSLLSAFDAFVLSSRTEGTPIALLEAMDASVPIVATRVGGVPDVVTSAHAILVQSEQPAMIAQALEQIEREPSAAKRRSLAARERLMESFGSETWLGRIEDVYLAASQRVAALPHRGVPRPAERRVRL